jgi:hypothetical protein
MATWAWILIAVVVVVGVALAVVVTRQRRTAELRRRFGPEYDRAVEANEDRRAAEAELLERERWRAELDIRPLPEEARVRYAQEWQDVQEHFVDQPSDAVVGADRLIYSVMEARGYPVGDFDAQAELVSVDHPQVVENYRYAHGIHQQARQASTEDLREALVRYRSLFEELLQAGDGRVDLDAADVDVVEADRAGVDAVDVDRAGFDAVDVDQADIDQAEASPEDASLAEGEPVGASARRGPAGARARRGPIVRPDRRTTPANGSEVLPDERS